jgi:hypothetical protein
MKTETIAPVVSAFIATASFLVTLFVVWMQRRESALRRGEVLAWANEVICALESLLLVSMLKAPQLDASAANSKLSEVIFNTAILVERGRVFFKNKVVDNYGSDKQPAYRGYRPKILDPIVVAHQIACRWGAADAGKRLRMRVVAEDSLKQFVSLVQKEVGRGKSVSADTVKGGDGVNLDHLLKAVDEQRLEKLQRSDATHVP